MPDQPATEAVGNDGNCSDAPAAKKQKKDNFSYHSNKLKERLQDISLDHPSCSIVIAIDSPFSHGSFRVLKSRHSTGDTVWDKDFEDFIKAAIKHKTFHPRQRLSDFLSRYTTTPITEEHLETAMRQCVADGNLASNQYTEILRTVDKMAKEEKEKAKRSECAVAPATDFSPPH